MVELFHSFLSIITASIYINLLNGIVNSWSAWKKISSLFRLSNNLINETPRRVFLEILIFIISSIVIPSRFLNWMIQRYIYIYKPYFIVKNVMSSIGWFPQFRSIWREWRWTFKPQLLMAAHQCSLLLGLLILVGSVAWTEPVVAASFNRSSFQAGFIFGTASASYQVRRYFCEFI